ncbi:MAG: FAD-dependent monooxygenase, partial [Rhizobiales bacterium]|nr:FAD-dependent monooxygenase [Rhizobacter sp.]
MNRSSPNAAGRVAVVGGGPAGLMAAEVLAAGGAQVDL